jgi:hypothetical protein
MDGDFQKERGIRLRRHRLDAERLGDKPGCGGVAHSIDHYGGIGRIGSSVPVRDHVETPVSKGDRGLPGNAGNSTGIEDFDSYPIREVIRGRRALFENVWFASARKTISDQKAEADDRGNDDQHSDALAHGFPLENRFQNLMVSGWTGLPPSTR